ncbi:MAG: hypothetical protein ACLFUQ_01380 [Candidatus Izemoplasmataceae bacterium]
MRRYIGAFILTIFVGVLLGLTLVSAWSIHLLAFLFVLGVTALAFFRAYHILKGVHTLDETYALVSLQAFLDFFTVFTGGVLTYALSVFIGVNAVLASGLVGILAALFFKPYAVALFCGSFIGMSSPELLSFPNLLIASLVASLIYVMAKDVFNGVGGKLGTIALSGVFVTCVLIDQPFLISGTLDRAIIFWILLFSVAGSTISNLLNVRLSQGAVMGSAAVGLVFGGFLPVFFSSDGYLLAVVAFGASFAGMASREYLGDEAWSALAGVVFALLFIYSAETFGGVGGKLGTIAFASTLSVSALSYIHSSVRRKVVQ